jgi:hypothetical protein
VQLLIELQWYGGIDFIAVFFFEFMKFDPFVCGQTEGNKCFACLIFHQNILTGYCSSMALIATAIFFTLMKLSDIYF